MYPSAQGLEAAHRLVQRQAGTGQPGGDRDRHGRHHGAGQQVAALQGAQCLGEHPLADAASRRCNYERHITRSPPTQSVPGRIEPGEPRPRHPGSGRPTARQRPKARAGVAHGGVRDTGRPPAGAGLPLSDDDPAELEKTGPTPRRSPRAAPGRNRAGFAAGRLRSTAPRVRDPSRSPAPILRP